MISLLFSLLALSILFCKLSTESLKFLTSFGSIVSTFFVPNSSSFLAIVAKVAVLLSVVSSISVNSFANIGKFVSLFALATKTVFSLFTTEVVSTLALGIAKRLLYISLAPNCIFAQEAFNFCEVVLTSFLTSFTSAFSFLTSVKISFCFSTSCITLASEKALVPFIRKSTARPIEYFTLSYLFAIERKVFSVFCRLLFPILF